MRAEHAPDQYGLGTVDAADALAPEGAYAYVAGRLATGLVEVAHDPSVLDDSGWWAVVGTFEGRWTLARFAHVARADPPRARRPWRSVPVEAWTTSLARDNYLAGVAAVRSLVAGGEVYQVNLCRVLSAALSAEASLDGLADLLRASNPAPHAARVHLPDVGVDVVSASPELFLRRDGRHVSSSPIKGTGATAVDLTDKDIAENVMIVDLVRNDLGRVCATGSVVVENALALEQHPGLVHLVSTVRGRLREREGWSDLLAATFPPGSVSGAPKSSALRAIADLEGGERGPYCGAVGWVDADRAEGELAVGIRAFWRQGELLRFGTGAGITWGSDPEREWRETELKAARLLGLAATDGSES
jgi:para-aminobenzoate synthetase component 1